MLGDIDQTEHSTIVYNQIGYVIVSRKKNILNNLIYCSFAAVKIHFFL